MAMRSEIDERQREWRTDKLNEFAKLPIVWEWSSSALFRAADILWKMFEEDVKNRIDLKVGDKLEPEIGPVAMMLYGLSIENLLKSVLIKKGGAFNENGKFKYASHLLLNLMEKANIEITEEENFLLERLEQYIIWCGKYPAPLKVEGVLNRKFANGGSAPLTMIQLSDRQLIHILFSKIEQFLEQLPQQ